MRFLNSYSAVQIENCLDRSIDHLRENGELEVANHLEGIYNRTQAGSDADSRLEEIRQSFEFVPSEFWFLRDDFNQISFGSVRVSNYPSGWRQCSTQALTDHITAHGNFCQAANCGLTQNQLTIDHVWPVAAHWNQYGRAEGRQDRANWYNDTSNHEYLCQSCNSSKGSGGVAYILQTLPGYSA